MTFNLADGRTRAVTLSDSSGTWKVTKMSSQLLPTSDYEPDPTTVALLNKLEALVRAGTNLDDYYGDKRTPGTK